MLTVDITVTLLVDTSELTAELSAALDALADIMAVQAEDGTWSGGNPDAEDSERVADLADGPDAITTAVWLR